MAFKRYVAKRTLLAVPSIFLILTLTFFLINTLTGDPIVMIVGEFETDHAYVELMREKFGLNKPLHIRYIYYLSNVLRGNLGYSVNGPPVLGLILDRIPATLLFMGSGLAFALLIGTFLGVAAASKPRSVVSVLFATVSVGGFAIPVFWLAQMLILVFALQLGWLPATGIRTLREDLTGVAYVVDILRHLLLPMVALGVQHLALVARLTRSSMLEELRKDYVLTARSKGLSPRKIVYRHALRNALLPIVTVTGMRIGYMLAGAVITETVFSWPGVGRLMYNSLRWRDYPVLMGIFLVISVSVILANLVTDLIYAFLDPRIRYE